MVGRLGERRDCTFDVAQRNDAHRPPLVVDDGRAPDVGEGGPLQYLADVFLSSDSEPLGVAGRVSPRVAGQLVISVLSDRVGWFGVARVGLIPVCSAGVLLAVVGTLRITRP